ncbi:MAG: hypothetical protein IE927_16190 [Rhodobacterales bacterium]|nr:hypothetical protein [Rhodobacterales bacterium]
MQTPLDYWRAGFDFWLGVWKAQQAVQDQMLLLMTGALLARQAEADAAAPVPETAAVLPMAALPGPCGPMTPAVRRRRRAPEAG